MNFGRKKEPVVKCVNLTPTMWQQQCFEFEYSLNNDKSTLHILSIKLLIANDPISAMNALQKIKHLVKMSSNHKLAGLTKDLLLVTPFTLHMAE